MNVNTVLEFIGSKWFLILTGIGMLFALPVTYGNFIVVYNAGALDRLWWVPTVFIINLLSAIMAIYKATGMFFSKKEKTSEWD